MAETDRYRALSLALDVFGLIFIVGIYMAFQALGDVPALPLVGVR